MDRGKIGRLARCSVSRGGVGGKAGFGGREWRSHEREREKPYVPLDQMVKECVCRGGTQRRAVCRGHVSKVRRASRGSVCRNMHAGMHLTAG